MNKLALLTVALAGSAAQAGTPGAITAWTPKDASAAWQGSWLTKLALRDSPGWSSLTGTYVALQIDGDHAKVWDASTKRDHDLGFRIDSPCVATFTEKSNGGTNEFNRNFLIDNGKLIVGSGGAGYRKGKAAIVCMSDNEVYLLDDKGHCKLWTDSFGKWEAKATTCKWSHEVPMWNTGADVKDVLLVGDGDMANQLVARGDVLVNIHFNDALDGKDHVQQADFAAAKLAAEKRFKETDPLERVKTAGGKIGDIATILGLNATFLSDKASVKGKAVTLAGQVVSVEKADDNGKPEYRVTLLDPRDKAKDWELICRSPKEVSAKAGDKLTIKGSVGEYWDRPAVTSCEATAGR